MYAFCIYLSIVYHLYVSVIFMYLSAIFLFTYLIFLWMALDFINPCCFSTSLRLPNAKLPYLSCLELKKSWHLKFRFKIWEKLLWQFLHIFSSPGFRPFASTYYLQHISGAANLFPCPACLRFSMASALAQPAASRDEFPIWLSSAPAHSQLHPSAAFHINALSV